MLKISCKLFVYIAYSAFTVGSALRFSALTLEHTARDILHCTRLNQREGHVTRTRSPPLPPHGASNACHPH
ncbi:unnamed protein product, partial [Brassica napus]